MINKITKEQYPELWDTICDEWEFKDKEHRRGSTFYTTLHMVIDDEIAPDNPEIHGDWESECITWNDDYGLDSDVDVLYRIEKKKVMVEVEQWTRVE